MAIVTIEVAALPKSALISFVKALYVVMASHYNGMQKPLISKMAEWGIQGMPVIKRFGLDSMPELFKQVKSGEIDPETFQQAGAEIRAAMPELQRETDIPGVALTIIKDSGLIMRTESESAFRRIQQRVALLKEPLLNESFVKDKQLQGPFEKALQPIVKKITGKSGILLDQDQKDLLKEKHPDLLKEYLRLRKGFNAAWEAEVQTMVRKSGKNFLPYKDVVSELQRQGYKHTLPGGFVGMIDGERNLYTTKGKKISQKPSPMFPTVKMNPDYDPVADDQWVFQAERADGKQLSNPYFYTVGYKIKGKQAKKEKVDQLMRDIKGIQGKWLTYVKRADPQDPKCVASVVLQMLYEYSARVGTGTSRTIADGTKTFGMTSVRVKHCRMNNGTLTVAYHGKDGVAARHIMKPDTPTHKMMLSVIAGLMKGKKPGDLLFEIKKGDQRLHLNPDIVNRFFKSLGAQTTVHKMRSVIGGLIFNREIKPLLAQFKGKKLTDSQGWKLLDKAAMAVGAKLNHVRRKQGAPDTITPKTALAAYIDPGAQAAFLDALGVRYPEFLVKLLKEDSI